ncbi:4943_t:CDS:1, partial [Scutellospora calospora]
NQTDDDANNKTNVKTKNKTINKNATVDRTKTVTVDQTKCSSVGGEIVNETKSTTHTEIQCQTTFNGTNDIIKTDNITKCTAEQDQGILERLKEIDDYINNYNPWHPKYDPEGFEQLLNEHFEETKLSQTVNNVGVFITAYNISNCERTFFTNLRPGDENVLMKEVTRASAAAPTYFPAKKIDSKYYIDGGVFMNNPTTRAYLEARKKYPNSKFVVISLGTGYFKSSLEDYKDAGIVQWVKPLITLLMDVELENHDDMMQLLAELDGATYYRIQPPLSEDASFSNVSDEEVNKILKLSEDIIKSPEYN